jgi:hypothetical protein
MLLRNRTVERCFIEKIDRVYGKVEIMEKSNQKGKLSEK